jgi:hypothetical protein
MSDFFVTVIKDEVAYEAEGTVIIDTEGNPVDFGALGGGGGGLTDAELRATPVPVSISGGSPAAGDVAHDAVDTGNPVKIGGKAESTAPTSVADGDRADAWFDLKGRLVVTPADDSGNRPYFAALNSTSIASPASKYGVASLSLGYYYNNSTGQVTANPGTSDGPVVHGNVAHDAVDTGNPIKIGGKAKLTAPTAVADGDRVDAWLDRLGRMTISIADSSGSWKAEPMDTTSNGHSNGTNALPVINYPYIWDGTLWRRQTGNADGTYSQGSIAHDAVDAGNPIKIGGRVSVTPSNVAAGDRVDATFDQYGGMRFTLFDHNTNNNAKVSNWTVDPGAQSWYALQVENKEMWRYANGYRRGIVPSVSGTVRLISSAATTNLAGSNTGAATVACFGITCNNTVGSDRYLKLYNSYNPTVGTTTPIATYCLPANEKNIKLLDSGQPFILATAGAGWAYAITANAADSDTTAIGAGDITCLMINIE